MDLLELGQGIGAHLEKECKKVDVVEEPNSEGGAWRFAYEGDLIGFMSCENNADDLDIPTVSTAVCLGDVTKADKKFLFLLLEVNGSFWRAHFTIQEMDKTRLLFIERRELAESYDPDSFGTCINELLEQYDLFMQEPEDD